MTVRNDSQRHRLKGGRQAPVFDVLWHDLLLRLQIVCRRRKVQARSWRNQEGQRLLMPKRIIFALSLGMILLVGIQQSLAHSWYTGKRDPITGIFCCGGYDCGPIEKVQVQAVSGGWLILSTGEVFAYSRTQTSEDDQFHRCVYLHGQRKGQTRCLFAPPMGF